MPDRETPEPHAVTRPQVWRLDKLRSQCRNVAANDVSPFACEALEEFDRLLEGFIRVR